MINNKEFLWVTYNIDECPIYCITSNSDRTSYFLYEMNDGDFVKTNHKSGEPLSLEKFINWNKTVTNNSSKLNKSKVKNDNKVKNTKVKSNVKHNRGLF